MTEKKHIYKCEHPKSDVIIRTTELSDGIDLVEPCPSCGNHMSIFNNRITDIISCRRGKVLGLKISKDTLKRCIFCSGKFPCAEELKVWMKRVFIIGRKRKHRPVLVNDLTGVIRNVSHLCAKYRISGKEREQNILDDLCKEAVRLTRERGLSMEHGIACTVMDALWAEGYRSFTYDEIRNKIAEYDR